MYISVKELYEFKENYMKQKEELNRKMEVVDELISYAEAKLPEQEAFEEETTEQEEVNGEEESL